jgi:hypothetical protein
MIVFECDGLACSERAEASSPPMYSIGGMQSSPALPVGWRRVEWTEVLPPRPPLVDLPDPTVAMLSAVLPHSAVERVKKAAEAQKIAQQINDISSGHEMMRSAEQRSAILCPKCSETIRLRRWTKIGMTAVPMAEAENDPPALTSSRMDH